MAEDAKTRELIEAVVAEVFDQHVRALHDDVVGRVICTIDALEKTKPERPVSQWLKSAIDRIESSGQQTDILKALLDSTAQFCERSALLVLRGVAGVMWQGRGFSDNDSLRTVSVDLSTRPCAIAVRQRVSALAQASEIHQKFATAEDRPCVVIPLLIREKVAALLYCDGALEGQVLDTLALELLAAAAGKWIELQAFRKTAGVPTAPPKVGAGATQHSVAETAGPSAEPSPQPVPSVHVVTATEPASHAAKGAPTAVAITEPQQQPPHVADGKTSVTVVPTEDQELHRKARRFAKLLVDEIILYNRDKVSEGRRNHDIYDRLKDDIDKSRATYLKRYGDGSVAKFDYFRQAVVSGLAEHNMALLGSNFPR